MTDPEIARLTQELEHASAIALSSVGQADRNTHVAHRERIRKQLAKRKTALKLNEYLVCDEHVDQRRNNQEHIYSYDAPDLPTALAMHKEAVGTEPVAIFDRAQKTVGFRQWA